MDAQTVKARIKSYQSETCNHVEVKNFPNYELFENGKLWSWSKLDWCKPTYNSNIRYQLVNHKTGVYKCFLINTLVKEHFGHNLLPQDENLKNLKHITLNYSDDYEIYQNGLVWSSSLQRMLTVKHIKGGHNGVFINGKLKQLHRLLYEHFINHIPKGYIIHHLNNIGTDNSLNNLILMQLSQHKRFHDNMRLNVKSWRKI